MEAVKVVLLASGHFTCDGDGEGVFCEVDVVNVVGWPPVLVVAVVPPVVVVAVVPPAVTSFAPHIAAFATPAPKVDLR